MGEAMRRLADTDAVDRHSGETKWLLSKMDTQ